MPFHLLSGVGINASLLSPAKATDFTHPHFLLFLSSLPHDSGYWLHHRKIQIFFIGSIRLAILFSLRASCLSGLPPKATRFDATVRNYPPCTEVHHHVLRIRLSHGVNPLSPHHRQVRHCKNGPNFPGLCIHRLSYWREARHFSLSKNFPAVLTVPALQASDRHLNLTYTNI